MARITWAPEVIDGVLAALRALDGYRAPTDTTDGVTVYDGPEALYYGDLSGSYVIVGYGGEDTIDPGDPSDDASEGTVSVRALAPTSPKENAESLRCLAVYQTLRSATRRTWRPPRTLGLTTSAPCSTKRASKTSCPRSALPRSTSR